MLRRRGPKATPAPRSSAEAGAACRSAWSSVQLHRCQSGRPHRKEAGLGQLQMSQLRLRAGAPWPRARCRRAPPLRLRASRRSRCPRFRRHRATDRHSGLLGVGRRRRFRGRRWPRRPARGQTRVGLHFSLRRRGRLGMLLVRRLIPAARRRGRCRRRDGCSRTRAGAAARQGWGQGGFRC